MANRLSDAEKEKIYQENKKPVPKNRKGGFLLLFYAMVLAVAWFVGLPMIAEAVYKSGRFDDINTIATIAYAGFFLIVIPTGAATVFTKRRIDREFEARKREINHANVELRNSLFDPVAPSDWRSVVEKYKDL